MANRVERINTMNKLMIPLFAATLLLTACGGSSTDANKEAAIQMAAESLEAEAGFYSEEYASCVLEGIVDITDLSWNDIEEALELDGNLDSLGAQTSPSEAEEEELIALAVTCMAEGDVLQDMMDDMMDDMTNDMMDIPPLDDARCEALSPECGWEWNEETQQWDDVWETQTSTWTFPDEPMNYGDDPHLDAIYDRCNDGSDAACAALWSVSAIDSEYETFADSCGGRNCDVYSLMYDGVWDVDEPADIPMSFGDHGYLDELYSSCEGGSDKACNTLFWKAPVDSEYEEFGLNYGGR